MNQHYFRSADLFKLTLKGKSDILGLLAVTDFPGEFRMQIQLLSVSRENLGKTKKYEGIAGSLIGFVGRMAVGRYFDNSIPAEYWFKVIEKDREGVMLLNKVVMRKRERRHVAGRISLRL